MLTCSIMRFLSFLLFVCLCGVCSYVVVLGLSVMLDVICWCGRRGGGVVSLSVGHEYVGGSRIVSSEPTC